MPRMFLQPVQIRVCQPAEACNDKKSQFEQCSWYCDAVPLFIFFLTLLFRRKMYSTKNTINLVANNKVSFLPQPRHRTIGVLYCPYPSSHYNYLCTCDLNSPVHNVLDGWIHYEGKWEEVGPWNLRLFGPCEMASNR
jgi:hypothetical protein